jgi:hydrogenase expression/formation protein HypC
MCLSIPAQVVALDVDRQEATVDVLGARRRASTMLVPEVVVGEWVLVHVGFAIARIDEEQARADLDLLDAALAAEELADWRP